jgi:hypothetical protein
MGVPDKLFRNTNLEFANKFIEEGEIMFRPLSYYRKIDDQIRRDENDGDFKVALGREKFKRFRLGEHELEPVRDNKLGIPTPQPNLQCISCFSIKPQSGFGPATIEVFNPIGFLDCVGYSVSQNLDVELKSGHVEYYDNTSAFPNQRTAWLYKEKRFSHEEEFRLGILIKRKHLGSNLERWVKDKNKDAMVTIRELPLSNFCRIISL